MGYMMYIMWLHGVSVTPYMYIVLQPIEDSVTRVILSSLRRRCNKTE